MDFTILGGVVGALLIAIPAVTAFFQRSTRSTRRENRKLRALVQEFDVHLFTLERAGWTSQGLPAPSRPPTLRAVNADDDDTDTPGPGASAGPGAAGGRDALGGPRHASGEG